MLMVDMLMLSSGLCQCFQDLYTCSDWRHFAFNRVSEKPSCMHLTPSCLKAKRAV